MPHHLLDVADIGQIFNAADFCDLAEQAIQVGPQVAHDLTTVGLTFLYDF